MEDAEYIFLTDAAEKKKIGRGQFNKVRGGGRYVRMPSDSLTRKERQSMNGEVVTYDLSKPVTWKEFRAWPDSIQVEYVKGLQKKYGAPAKFVSQMLGIHQTTLSGWSKRHGVAWKARGKDSKLPYAQWEAFINGNVPTASEQEGKEITVSDTLDPVEPVTLHADKNNIAAVLAMLIGTGAKLTIEVTL